MKEPFFKTLPGKLCCILLALVLAVGGFFGIRAATGGRIRDSVTIGGLDVGGMTRKEARTALKAALNNSLYTRSLTVQLPQEEIAFTPAELDASVNIRKAVRAAYAFGRKETAAGPDISILPYLQLNEEGIRETLTDYAARWDTELRQPEWEVTGEKPLLSTDRYDPTAPGQLLVLTKGVPEVHLDVAQVYGEIWAVCGKAIPLCAKDSFLLRPEVAPDALPEELDLDTIYQQIALAPVSDSLDLEAYGFVHGSYGYGFDREATAASLTQTEAGGTLSVPMTVIAPEIQGDAVYFRDVLGSCETKHNDDENRNTNLRLLCQALDGHILQPGEEFSYNGVVGERTAERGYKPATAYSGKRMIKDIGGGVCQGSTTLYNCALLADLEILERVCHGAKVSYVKLGLDAAVNWNTKTDLRFKNNFHFPIMIKAEVSDGYVKMQLLGTDEKDYYVEMYCKSGAGDTATYASSYKKRIHKETGEILSDELEARSAYYELS